jgi:hypothetical protein
MTLRDLLLVIERETVLAALADEGARESFQRLECAALDWAASQKALRIDRTLLPQAWVRNQDPTQIDGRVLVSHRDTYMLYCQIPSGPPVHYSSGQLLVGLMRGWIVEAS